MKSEILNLRIPAALKEKLEKEANDNGITLSDLARDIISSHYETIVKDNLIFNLDYNFYTSNEFIYLLTWIFEKRLNNYDSNNIHVLERLKRIAMKAMNNSDFPPEIKKEFEKVYVDLSRYIYQYGITYNYFVFS